MQLIVFLLYIFEVVRSTYTPSWGINNKVQAGYNIVYGSYTASGTSLTYVFNFASAFSGIPKIGYGIKAYKGI